MSYHSFYPQIIAEITNLCDRQCHGCYAPNVLTSEANAASFISLKNFSQALQNYAETSDTLALRGGEPSLHPNLKELLFEAKKYCNTIYLETHARWVQKEDATAILRVLCETATVVKISFDKMHALSSEHLAAITAKLEQHGVVWVIAITESDAKALAETKLLCPWVTDEKIIFQAKATRLTELLKPEKLVIKVDGTTSQTLTHKFNNSKQMEFSV